MLVNNFEPPYVVKRNFSNPRLNPWNCGELPQFLAE